MRTRRAVSIRIVLSGRFGFFVLYLWRYRPFCEGLNAEKDGMQSTGANPANIYTHRMDNFLPTILNGGLFHAQNKKPANLAAGGFF